MTEPLFQYDAIGSIRTSYESREEMPIQPIGADGAVGTVEVDPSYAEGVEDLDGFTHCILLYHFHAVDDTVSIQVEPFLNDTNRGLFATRAPQRPNPIGLSVVVIDSVTDHEVTMLLRPDDSMHRNPQSNQSEPMSASSDNPVTVSHSPFPPTEGIDKTE